MQGLNYCNISVKLHQMSGNIPDVCSKCLDNKGTLYHCLWECPEIQNFWKEVIKCMSNMFNIKIPLNVKLCILGMYPTDFIQTSRQIQLIDFGLFQTRRAIALCWKSMNAPSMRMWKKEISNCIGLERLKPSSHYMILKRRAELCSSHYKTCSQ